MKEKVFDFQKPAGGGKTTIILTRDMPFYNVCPVFGWNDCMVAKLSYVPSDKVIENSVFRTFFDRKFNQKVESIAVQCFDYINQLINPEQMTVEISLVKGTNDHGVIIRVSK